MTRMIKPGHGMAAKRQATEEGKPAVERLQSGENALEKRIERLEQRMEESVRGNDGLAVSRTDRGLDGSETEDALKRAVSRSQSKRGGGKP
ncbi:MAG: hypothetical protein H0T56_12190 [Pseudaminobacter sp.]|nr:hypothetical protein [Pseudaminobacter sp.]